MWQKNLKSFLNHLQKSKLYTSVTLLGFTISLTFVILLSVYIKHETSVNVLQEKKDRIFRLINESGSDYAPPIGLWLQNEFPEIESYTRIYNNTGTLITPDNTKLKINYLLADSTFFDIFSFKILDGNKETALKSRNAVVLSQEFSNRVFGQESPLYKQITIDEIECVVYGVVEDISKKSNFDACDAIINFRSLADFWGSPRLLTSMGNCSFGLYFLAKPNTDLPAKAPQVLALFKKDFWMYQDDRINTVVFEPLSDNYFSPINGKAIQQNNITLISVLFAIVILILILAIINYMNLTIAQSGLRVKGIAIKKLLGSSRKELIIQHVIESVILCFAAFLLAVLASSLAEPLFNGLLNTELNLAKEFTNSTILLSLVFVVTMGLVSGIIPALIITRLHAVQVIKGAYRRKSKSIYSKILIGFQYMVVIVLIVATITISRQTDFMRNHQLGFNSRNIVWLNNNIKPVEMGGFRNVLLAIPGVKRVSFVAGSPLDAGNNMSFKFNEKPVSFQIFKVDSSFFPMMEMKITPTGAAYSKKGIWLNKKTVDELGLDSLPTSFQSYKGKDAVLGIVENFYFESLHRKIGLAMIRQLNDEDEAWQILVQIEGSAIYATLDKVKKAYAEFTHDLPFDYGFFDDTVESWYESEKRTTTIVSYFTILSIVISIMGIFAMSVFYNQQKIKEIGIRKVNGASVLEIVQMLNMDFVKWVSIAFVVACPIAYYAMNRWLQNFPYRITISWWYFALAGIFALSIALITVSWQTYRAAHRNPVEALRYE